MRLFKKILINHLKKGKYPLLSTINHYLNPDLKIDLPKESAIRKKIGAKDDEINAAANEYDFFKKLTAKTIGNFNVFNLIQNDGIYYLNFFVINKYIVANLAMA